MTGALIYVNSGAQYVEQSHRYICCTRDDVKTNAIRIEPVRSECYYQFTATTHSFLYKIQKLFYLIIRMNNSLTLSLGLTIQKNHTSKFIMVHHRRPQLRTHAPVQIAFPLIRSFFTMHTFWIKIFNGLDVVCVYMHETDENAQRDTQQIMYSPGLVNSFLISLVPTPHFYTQIRVSHTSHSTQPQPKTTPPNICNLCHLSFAHTSTCAHTPDFGNCLRATLSFTKTL